MTPYKTYQSVKVRYDISQGLRCDISQVPRAAVAPTRAHTHPIFNMCHEDHTHAHTLTHTHTHTHIHTHTHTHTQEIVQQYLWIVLIIVCVLLGPVILFIACGVLLAFCKVCNY